MEKKIIENIKKKDADNIRNFSDSSNQSYSSNDNEELKDINFDNLSDSVSKIHLGIILLTISLFFSYSQSLRNKNLKDEEISSSDIITGLIYMCLMIFSLIRIFNSYMSLSKEYEDTIKNTKINKKNFMKCK